MKAESGDAAAQPGEPPSSDPWAGGGSFEGGGTLSTLPFDRRAAELQRPAAGKEPAFAPDPFHPPEQPPPDLPLGALQRDPPAGSIAEAGLPPQMLISGAPQRAGGAADEASSSAAHAEPAPLGLGRPESGQSGGSSAEAGGRHGGGAAFPGPVPMGTAPVGQVPAPAEKKWTIPDDEYVQHYRGFLRAYAAPDKAVLLQPLPTGQTLILGLPGEMGLAVMLQEVFASEDNVSRVVLYFITHKERRGEVRASYADALASLLAPDEVQRRASQLAEAVLPHEGEDLERLFDLLTALRGVRPARCLALCTRFCRPPRAPALS